MAKKQSISKLKKRLDTLVSQYVRRSRIEQDGLVPCFTCGIRKPWKEIQNGHFMSRIHINTRFDIAANGNCQPQCYRCNINLSGNQWNYARKLNERFGKGTAEEIEARSKIVLKLSAIEYKEKIKEINGLLKLLTD